MSNPISSFSDFSTQKSFSIASYISSLFTSIGGALTLNDLAILAGILFALLTFAVNWIYQERRDNREKALHQINLELARKELKQT
jgi:preprotein translocase subunit SecG